MDAEDPSPLRRFVIAKRSITSIFDQLLDFVRDGSAFVDGVARADLGQVAVEEQSLRCRAVPPAVDHQRGSAAETHEGGVLWQDQ
ncbi:hypothetical protein INR49_027210 [Caranx melampygus]|nr:hypothetical protein INR49_027210 [Caranx melampygus]